MTPEDQLTALMEAAAGDLDAPLGDILAGAELRGRRLRRRRRVAMVVGAMATTLLSAAGAGVGLRLADAQSVGAEGYQGTASSRGHASGAPSPGNTSALAPIDVSAEILILHTLLPATWSFSDPQQPTTADLTITMDDGNGEFTVSVAVTSAARSGTEAVDCKLERLPTLSAAEVGQTGTSHEGCAEQTYPNGDKALQEAVGGVRVGGYYEYRVIVDRADGVAVEIGVSDGLAATRKATRTAPPMSLTRWTAIARDQLWQLEVPVSPAQSSADGGPQVMTDHLN